MDKYIVYRTTCTINNKIYIGCHKLKSENDTYLGSGKYLLLDIEKYGNENFNRVTLFEYDNSEDALNKETDLVTKEFVKREDTYNSIVGGGVGWDAINKAGKNLYKITDSNRAIRAKNMSKHSKLRWNNPETRSRMIENSSKALKEAYSSGRIKPPFQGKHHTKETKAKIGAITSVSQSGNKNSQYGKVWVYNKDTDINKSIKKELLDDYIQLGYIKGRKLK